MLYRYNYYFDTIPTVYLAPFSRRHVESPNRGAVFPTKRGGKTKSYVAEILKCRWFVSVWQFAQDLGSLAVQCQLSHLILMVFPLTFRRESLQVHLESPQPFKNGVMTPFFWVMAHFSRVMESLGR